MKPHTIYKVATGKIVSWGGCVPDPEEDEDWIEGIYHGDKFRIVNGQPVPQTPVEPSASEILLQERQRMVCSPLQGRLVLGATVCAQLDAVADDPDTPWAMRETIKRSVEWHRTSQAMDELGYLLGFTDEQIDSLFRTAMTVSV